MKSGSHSVTIIALRSRIPGHAVIPQRTAPSRGGSLTTVEATGAHAVPFQTCMSLSVVTQHGLPQPPNMTTPTPGT